MVKENDYLFLSENGTKVVLFVNKKMYLVDTVELVATLEGERKYTQITSLSKTV